MNIFDSRNRAFIDNYNDYYALVYSIVYSKLGHAEDSHDLSQEVFTRFFEKIDVVENPRKWLLGTLRNVLFEHYRKKRSGEVNIDDVFEDVSLSFVNGFRDTRLIIEEALQDPEIFPEEREWILFQLIAVHRFSYKEAAMELGIPERRARYRYGLTGKRLLDYFRKRGVHHLEDLL